MGSGTLDTKSSHGPANQFDFVKPVPKDLGTVYYGQHSGFSRYQTAK